MTTEKASTQNLFCKRLFHYVKPTFSPGPDVPSNFRPEGPNDYMGLITPQQGRAFVVVSVLYQAGYFEATIFAYTIAASDVCGWNVRVNFDGGGSIEREFIPPGGPVAKMALNDALYMAACEVDCAIASEDLRPEELDAKLKSTLKYLGVGDATDLNYLRV